MRHKHWVESVHHTLGKKISHFLFLPGALCSWQVEDIRLPHTHPDTQHNCPKASQGMQGLNMGWWYKVPHISLDYQGLDALIAQDTSHHGCLGCEVTVAALPDTRGQLWHCQVPVEAVCVLRCPTRTQSRWRNDKLTLNHFSKSIN